MITLSAYAPPTPGPDPFPDYAAGLQQIDTNILNNPQARPSFWAENVDGGGGNLYRVHLNDNGMLIQEWTIDWGDGSQPQQVWGQPWVVHQYTGGSSQYAITVIAFSYDGTYASGTGDTPVG